MDDPPISIVVAIPGAAEHGGGAVTTAVATAATDTVIDASNLQTKYFRDDDESDTDIDDDDNDNDGDTNVVRSFFDRSAVTVGIIIVLLLLLIVLARWPREVAIRGKAVDVDDDDNTTSIPTILAILPLLRRRGGLGLGISSSIDRNHHGMILH